MLSQSTIRLAPLAERYGHICRWLWLALPEDANQEAALALYLHPGLPARAIESVIRQRFRVLRHEVWDREPTRPPRMPSSLRPSKLARCTGYRTDSAAHREARQKVNPELRRAIARKGQAAWRDANFSSR